MKRVFLYSAVAVFVLLSAAAPMAEEQPYKRYGVEKLLIKFKVTGAQEGIEELAFDRFGMRERKRTIVRTMGMETRKIVIINGYDMYTIDETAKTADRIDTPLVKELIAQGKSDMSVLASDMMKEMGGRVVGQEKILGRLADVWEIESMGARTWIWKGIALKTTTNMGGVMMQIEAYDIDDDPALKDADFAPAPDVRVTDHGTMQELMQKSQQQ